MDFWPLLTLDTVLLVLVLHFVADYLLQSHAVMINKGKHFGTLVFHVILYSLPFFIFFGPVYAVINALIHGVVDFFSSRLNNILCEWKNPKWFYTNIAADQLIHISTLFITYSWLF